MKTCLKNKQKYRKYTLLIVMVTSNRTLNLTPFTSIQIDLKIKLFILTKIRNTATALTSSVPIIIHHYLHTTFTTLISQSSVNLRLCSNMQTLELLRWESPDRSDQLRHKSSVNFHKASHCTLQGTFNFSKWSQVECYQVSLNI